MAKYNGNIKNLLQGMSQQPERERRPEQLSELINCSSSVTRGLGKRPGTYFVDSIGETQTFGDLGAMAFYHYDRGDTDEAYLFCLDGADIRVFDLFTGDEQTVNHPDGLDYISTWNPETAFKFQTVADTTFIVNNEIEPLMENPTDDGSTWEIMLHCKQAQFGKTYEFIVDGSVEATYTTPSTVTLDVSASEQDVDKRITLDTTDVIDNLRSGGLNAWATAEGVTIRQKGDVLHMSQTGASTYKIQTNDGNNGNDLIAVGQSIAKYADLPEIALDGYKVKVTGVDSSKKNDYYVQFNADDDDIIGRGVWEESAGFDVDQSFDPETMPHKIVRNSSGEFDFGPIEWVDRSAGDDDSNPKPSFVGVNISDVSVYQGRLVLTTEENQVGSVTFDFFNFFAPSVLQESDDDPIDTASSDTQVTDLNHTIVFNSALVSFSDSAQFFHTGETAFTSKTFTLASKSKYPCSAQTSPVAAASSIFMPFSFGDYSGIRELQYDGLTGNLRAETITDHVRKYIAGDISQLEASAGYNKLFVRAEDDLDILYVYEWYDRDNSRLQAAWSHWDFGMPVYHMGFVRNQLYLLCDYEGDVVLMYVDMSDQDTEDIPFPLRLDMMEYVEGSLGADYWTIPSTVFDLNPDADIRVIAGDDTRAEGLLMEHYIEGGEVRINDELIRSRYENEYVNPIWVESGYTESPEPFFWVGIPYEAKGVLTNPYIRGEDGDPITTERLRLNFVEFNLAETGYIDLNLTKGSSEFTKTYAARVTDRIGIYPSATPDIQDIRLRLGVRSDRDRAVVGFSSEDHTPFYVLDVNWTGNYSSSGRRN